MAEAGHEFAVVEFPLGAEIAVVEQGLVFYFGGFEMQEHPLAGSVGKEYLPLGELAHVHPLVVMIIDVGEYVLIVSGDVQGEEGKSVHALRGQVVYGADELLTPAAAPGGVAFPPVLAVGRPVLDPFVAVAVVVESTVEGAVSEEIFRRVSAGFEEDLARFGPDRILAATEEQTAPRAQIAAGFVGGGYGNFSAHSVQRFHRFAVVGQFGHGGVSALAETDLVGPFARVVGREVDAPFVATGSAGFGRLTVGGEITRYYVDGGIMTKGDVQAVVQERVEAAFLLGSWSVQGKCNIVPFFQLTTHGYLGADAGAKSGEKEQGY